MRNRLLSVVLSVVGIGLSVVGVSAQTPVPVSPSSSGVGFQDSANSTTLPDGSPIISRYELRFIPSPTCGAVGAVNLGKPTPDASGNLIVKPIPQFGNLTPNCPYTAVVVAVGPTGLEGVSVPTVPFFLPLFPAPPAPTNPQILP